MNASSSVLFVQLLRHTSPPTTTQMMSPSSLTAFFTLPSHPSLHSSPLPTTRLALDLNSHSVQVVEIHPSETGQTPTPFQNNLCHQLPWVEFSSSVLQQAAVSWAALVTGVLLHIGRFKNMAIKCCVSISLSRSEDK